MNEILFVAIVSGFCFALLALIMRAFAMDAWEARRVGYMQRQQRLAMAPAAKERQKALVVELASKRLAPTRGLDQGFGGGYGRTA